MPHSRRALAGFILNTVKAKEDYASCGNMASKQPWLCSNEYTLGGNALQQALTTSLWGTMESPYSHALMAASAVTAVKGFERSI